MIEQNIVLQTKRFEINREEEQEENIVFDFNFTMYTLGLLMEMYNYKDIDNITQELTSEDWFSSYTCALRILYCSLGINDSISYYHFVKLFDTQEKLNDVYRFICEHLHYFLSPQKKSMMPLEKMERNLMKMSRVKHSLLTRCTS